MHVEITLFTDPACPFAFSAEPVRMRLRWHYGSGLRWQPRMIEPGEAERLAEGGGGLQRRFGMPMDPQPYSRPASCRPACRAVVAARLRAPGSEESLLRRLRMRTMAGGLIDDPELIAAAAGDVGLAPAELAAWSETTDQPGRGLRGGHREHRARAGTGPQARVSGTGAGLGR